MNKNIFYQVCSLFILIAPFVNAQWNSVYNNSSEHLECIYFINELKGWVGTRSGKILRTTDGGENWTTIQLDSLVINSIYFLNEEYGWCASGGYWGDGQGKIYKTTNGGNSWVEIYNTTTQLESIFFNNLDKGWAVGTAYFIGGQLLTTSDGGDSWETETLSGNPSRPMDIYFMDEQIGYIVGGEPAKIYKTTNAGISWTISVTNTQSRFLDISFGNEFLGVCVGWDGIVKTSDGGISWEELILGPSYYYGVECRSPRIWITGHQIFNSKNNGKDWLPQTDIDTTAFLGIDFINDSVGWAIGTSGIIMKTTNGGDPEVGAPEKPNLIHPHNDSIGIVLPVNFMWQELPYSSYEFQLSSDSLFYGIIEDRFFVNNYFETILVPYTEYFWRVRSNNLNGVSEWSDIFRFTTSIVEIKQEMDEYLSFNLYQNYPNPFNPETNIDYQIPKREFVSLKVYDILGKMVATVVNEEKSAGKYSVKFDGSSFASGIYFCQLKAGDFTAAKKLILLK